MVFVIERRCAGMKKNILDEQDKIFKNDPENMLSCIEDLPDQIKDCWGQISNFVIPAHYINIKNIVIAGMGGSAIGGDIVRVFVHDNAKKPIQLVRDYELPSYVSRDTLVISSSYSGTTEEALSCYDMAKAKGAKIIGIASGSRLMQKCQEDKTPCFKIDYASQPRAAMGYSITALLGILSKLGVIDFDSNNILEAYKDMKN